jgi:hypothetical protein
MSHYTVLIYRNTSKLSKHIGYVLRLVNEFSIEKELMRAISKRRVYFTHIFFEKYLSMILI